MHGGYASRKGEASGVIGGIVWCQGIGMGHLGHFPISLKQKYPVIQINGGINSLSMTWFWVIWGHLRDWRETSNVSRTGVMKSTGVLSWGCHHFLGSMILNLGRTWRYIDWFPKEVIIWGNHFQTIKALITPQHPFWKTQTLELAHLLPHALNAPFET